MIPQISFLFSLFALGLLFGLCLTRKIPLWFILSAAIFWGALNWVMVAIPVTWIMGAFSFPITATVVALEAVGIILYLILRKPLSLTGKQAGFIGGYTLGLLSVIILFTKFNLTTATNDSLFLISMGQDLAASGYSLFHLAAPASYEIFVSMLQAASASLKIDYLAALQPVFSVNFIALFIFACVDASRAIKKPGLRLLLALLAAAFLFSSQIMRFEFAFIHTNLLTGIYLFIAVLSLIYFEKSRENVWMVLSTAALLGFALLRTENVLFSLILLGLSMSFFRVDFIRRIRFYLPYLLLTILWLIAIYLMDARCFNVVLNHTVLKLSLAALGAFALFILISKLRLVDQKLLPKLPALILGGLALAIIAGLFVKRDVIGTSLQSMLSQLFLSGAWDTCWAAALFLALFLAFEQPGKQKSDVNRFFLYLIPCYFLFILFLSYSRTPYEIVWTDSDNRMFVQVLPLVVFWIVNLLNEKELARAS